MLEPTIEPQPMAQQLDLPPSPSGFEWKILPENKLAFLIPDGWFFEQVNFGTEEIYITKEKIDHYRRFSTGLKISVHKDFKSTTEAEQYSIDILDYYLNLDAEKEIVAEWDDQLSSFNVHHTRIKAGFPFASESNEYETVEIFAIPIDTWVYLFILQCPTELCEQTMDQYDILREHIVITKQ
jgi:hypothetical protein